MGAAPGQAAPGEGSGPAPSTAVETDHQTRALSHLQPTIWRGEQWDSDPHPPFEQESSPTMAVSAVVGVADAQSPGITIIYLKATETRRGH